MKSLSEIQKLLNDNKDRLTSKYNISRIGIFGSVVKNKATEKSDVDIIVEFSQPIGLDFVLLANELEMILGCDVDLVSSNAIKKNMKKYIEEDLIYV